MVTVVSLGSLFWITVALLTSYVVFEGKKFSAGFGSACVMEYKKCILDRPLSDCIQPLSNCGDINHDDFKKFVMPPLRDRGPLAAPRKEEKIDYTQEENEENNLECRGPASFLAFPSSSNEKNLDSHNLARLIFSHLGLHALRDS